MRGWKRGGGKEERESTRKVKEERKKKRTKKNKIKKGKAINKKNLISFPIKGFLLNIINVAVLFFWTGLLFVIGPSFEMNPIKIWTFFFQLRKFM